ncbi:hypothetical protein BT96DRAFT_1009405 [Gymnopus androsaceus JB14]|uniref:Uncharacterized protein n=1 Tax=Gymnopus androsaceus JB14 TaxID=1447944 RepID=A0A6A4GCY5_9AGAR|nr:hypothetical protein BT96DRAFT_1009405 [Gymnopus androsaceus JB14]
MSRIILLYFVLYLFSFLAHCTNTFTVTGDLVVNGTEDAATKGFIKRINTINASQAALEKTFEKFMLSMDHLNLNTLGIIAWISDSNSRIIDSVSTHSVLASAHLGRDGRPLSASLQEHAQHIQRLVLFTELQLDHLDTIKDTFISMNTFVYQEKELISRAQAKISLLLLWSKSLEKALDEEEKALDALVKWLDNTLSLIRELQDHLQALRSNLVDVKHHYQGMELTGYFFCVSRLKNLERSLAGVDVSLDRIAVVLKSVQQ